MKKLNKQLFVGFSFMFALLFANVMNAQQTLTLDWTTGAFANEPGYDIIQVSNGAVLACEATYGATPVDVTVSAPEGETYNV